jgi:hypothetical protein
MKLAPTTILTEQLLLQDQTAKDIGLWKIETTIRSQKVQFCIYQEKKLYKMFLTRPQLISIDKQESLEGIIKTYNDCISNGRVQAGRTL